MPSALQTSSFSLRPRMYGVQRVFDDSGLHAGGGLERDGMRGSSLPSPLENCWLEKPLSGIS